jgi:protein-S-isoprenylcysteine O-methyltransferase Ste14
MKSGTIRRAVPILLSTIVLPLIVVRLPAKYPHDPMTYAGIGIIIPSFVLLLIAYNHLGGSFAITPQANELVTKGVYARIRHPIYVFGALLFLGFAMVTRGVLSCALLVIAIVDGIRRARKENRTLEENFGDAYRAYRRKTWF